jgi:hypothetical protein
MGKIVTIDLPSDLPENWSDTQYVSPGGTEVGLSAKHGYNYLMKQVNAAHRAILQLDDKVATTGGEMIRQIKDLDASRVPGHYLFLDEWGVFGPTELLYDIEVSEQSFANLYPTIVQTATRVYCSDYPSAIYSRVYYYANTATTDGWTAWERLATITEVAPRSLVYGKVSVTTAEQLNSSIMEFFNSMPNDSSHNFIINCIASTGVLEGGTWVITIDRISVNFGTVYAKKYLSDLSSYGIMMKTCSIYNKQITNWGSIGSDYITPATVE